MKKLSYFLILAILASCVSCSSELDPESSSEESTKEIETETTSAISSDLPDKTYDGYEFTFLSTDEVGSIRYSYELFAESENGEPINDAVYKRNRMVEEQFDVNINVFESSTPDTLFKNSVLADDNDYDCLVYTMDGTLKNIASQYCAPISELPYVDIDKSYWDTDIINAAAINNVAFGLTGDINLVDNKATWCILFNKRIAGEYIDEDLYELVKSGKWTLDKLAAYSKLASNDLNGDSIMNEEDQWGLLASGNVAAALLWSCGGSLGSTDSSGNVITAIDSEKNINILEKIYNVFSDRDSIIDSNRVPKGDYTSSFVHQRAIFNEGRALFIGGLISYVDYFNDMDDGFGILPLPKYDEDQKDYICTVQEWCATMLSVPKNAENLERTSVILEALCSASVSTITEAYYDVTLQRKRTQDEESREMLDIIFASRIFDTVYAYNFGSIRSTMTSILLADSNTISSTIASVKTSVQADIEKFIDNLN